MKGRFSNFLFVLLFLPFAVAVAGEDNVVAGHLQRQPRSDAALGNAIRRRLRLEDTSKSTIAQIVAMMPDTFSTLLAALKAAGLVGAVADVNADLTVFAPINKAFKRLGNRQVRNLLRPKNRDTLTDILLFHVYPDGSVASSDLTDGQSITMANGDDITVSIKTGRRKKKNKNKNKNNRNLQKKKKTVLLFPGRVRVLQADIVAKNGIIHVVNKVLVPPTEPEV